MDAQHFRARNHLRRYLGITHAAATTLLRDVEPSVYREINESVDETEPEASQMALARIIEQLRLQRESQAREANRPPFPAAHAAADAGELTYVPGEELPPEPEIDPESVYQPEE